MKLPLEQRRVRLTLPVMPPKFHRGDKRNYRRWHCWVEAVRALAAHYRDHGRAPVRRRRR